MPGKLALQSSEASDWNRPVLLGLSIVLLLAGLLGFVIPPERALSSGAVPYNLFHIAAGLLGASLAARGSPRAQAGFNFSFGLADLYLALAGVTGLFPAHLFALKPADHVIHVLLGGFLVVVGLRGLVRRPRLSPSVLGAPGRQR